MDKPLTHRSNRACALSITRTYYAWGVTRDPNVSYVLVTLTLLSYAEIALGIIVSCVPTLPRFFQYVVPKVRGLVSPQSKIHGISETVLEHQPIRKRANLEDRSWPSSRQVSSKDDTQEITCDEFAMARP